MTDTRLRHFEALYSASDDPWNVRGAWYEQRKRAILLASLAKPHYRNAFEPGCGNGASSAALAPRCERLLASDGAAAALDAARRDVPPALAGAIRFEQRRLPDDWPDGETFDLIVISELAYYFPLPEATALLARAAAGLAPDGELVMCHYLHDFDDRACSTEALHRAAGDIPGLRRRMVHHDQDFVLETWSAHGGHP
ncbi:methyltransferase domain-containing protein [Massilia sp. CFBP9026]|uniref:methyltransferase domain-containing protein n=1 Tax=Massilia sp. CFBP9026 TaxID=3096536 RepID=UPI002A6A0787|nr:methyltransferase domain-containing protein [Massilia sp. CFBP9026]MDY0964803.1 methyltransferase domain-containing protein [Massilia sp. CFBP9026]